MTGGKRVNKQNNLILEGGVVYDDYQVNEEDSNDKKYGGVGGYKSDREKQNTSWIPVEVLGNVGNFVYNILTEQVLPVNENRLQYTYSPANIVQENIIQYTNPSIEPYNSVRETYSPRKNSVVYTNYKQDLSKINKPAESYISFKTQQYETEPLFKAKKDRLVSEAYKNEIKMQNRADLLYGSDEEYYKKYYENIKKQKPQWAKPQETTVSEIANVDNLLYKTGNLAEKAPNKEFDLTKIDVKSQELSRDEQNRILKALGLEEDKYDIKGNSITPVKNVREYDIVNGVKYPLNTSIPAVEELYSAALNKKREERSQYRENYLKWHSLLEQLAVDNVNNINNNFISQFDNLPLKENIENLHMSKADSYLDTGYAHKRKIFNNYKELNNDFQDYFKEKISRQIGADKLETTKGIYFDSNDVASQHLKEYLLENSNFINLLGKYKKAIEADIYVNDSFNFNDFNWHNALGNVDIRNMHKNSDGNIELYVTDVYDFNDVISKNIVMVGRNRQDKGEIIPYFIIYKIIIDKNDVIKTYTKEKDKQ